MAFKFRASHLIAVAITVGIAGWMAMGSIEVGGQQENGESATPIIERETERSADLFKVRFVPLMPQERQETLLVRGRTEASAIIPIRAETGGILLRRAVDKGERVEPGDLVCEIDKGSRKARVAQAEAQLEQARLDFEANSKLKERGFASETKIKQLAAALEGAKAVLAEAQLDLDRTQMKAKASGTVQDPIAKAGDMLRAGDVCVTLIDNDPMLFVGQVSERDIAKVSDGMQATVELVTGEKVNASVRYVASSADPQTRTFLIELELDASGQEVRDGLTAAAHIMLSPTIAYRVSPAWVSLADNGDIGLKVVDENDVVRFVPVEIVAQDQDGFWLQGPEPGLRTITVGHEYVVAGEKVEALPDPVVNARLETAGEAENGKVSQ